MPTNDAIGKYIRHEGDVIQEGRRGPSYTCPLLCHLAPPLYSQLNLRNRYILDLRNVPQEPDAPYKGFLKSKPHAHVCLEKESAFLVKRPTSEAVFSSPPLPTQFCNSILTWTIFLSSKITQGVGFWVVVFGTKWRPMECKRRLMWWSKLWRTKISSKWSSSNCRHFYYLWISKFEEYFAFNFLGFVIA